MKTLGFIGGVTWHSTIEYYRLINQMIHSRLGSLHSAKMVITSTDFEELYQAQNSGDLNTVTHILKDQLLKLERAGADFFAIGANTLHMHVDALKRSTSLPLVHIVDETAREAQSLKLQKLCLLGTGFTMKHRFFVDRMKDHGIETIVPDDSIKDKIHKSIFEELAQGMIKDQTRLMYRDISKKMVDHEKCDGIILGCTEIPLVLSPNDVADLPVKLLDTTKIHAQAIVNQMLDS